MRGEGGPNADFLRVDSLRREAALRRSRGGRGEESGRDQGGNGARALWGGPRGVRLGGIEGGRLQIVKIFATQSSY